MLQGKTPAILMSIFALATLCNSSEGQEPAQQKKLGKATQLASVQQDLRAKCRELVRLRTDGYNADQIRLPDLLRAQLQFRGLELNLAKTLNERMKVLLIERQAQQQQPEVVGGFRELRLAGPSG